MRSAERAALLAGLERCAQLGEGVFDNGEHRRDGLASDMAASGGEAYVQGRASLRAHFRLRRPVNDDARDWCAAFYRHPHWRDVFDDKGVAALGDELQRPEADVRERAGGY